MKQHIWLFNSSLFFIICGNVFLCFLLNIDLPHVKMPRLQPIKDEDISFTPLAVQSSIWATIYKQDLFDTYQEKNKQLVKENLVTPIPALTIPTLEIEPELKNPEIIPPLVVGVKGIIVGADESDNVVMLEDETKKETLYHVGDTYKDSCILKIAHNRVVLLRTNGQQETIFLRKFDDINAEAHTVERWEYIIKKKTDVAFEIDPDNFIVEVPSLGNFIERLDIVGGVYKKNKSVGLRLGILEKNDLADRLGLQKDDILLRVNGLSVVSLDDRLSIYDVISNSRIGDVIKLDLKRNGTEQQIQYTLIKINRIKEYVFVEEKKPTPAENELLKTSALQDREKQMREFNNQQPNEQHQDAIAMLRKRLLDNLRTRWQTTQPQ